ncbi:MAG: Uncharacterised protein [Owenweeksia sp. TMED14]|nr:MAG: Uncharacterised protein [Owenweeksia sp. TMED14]
MEVKVSGFRIALFFIIIGTTYSCGSTRDCDCPSFSYVEVKSTESTIYINV